MPLSLKPTDWESVFSIGDGGILQTTKILQVEVQGLLGRSDLKSLARSEDIQEVSDQGNSGDRRFRRPMRTGYSSRSHE